MIRRKVDCPDDAETRCETISLVLHLESANEKLRRTVAELTHVTKALRQELEKTEGREHAADTSRQGSNDDL